MARMPRPLTRDERAARATETYEVIGSLPIRDAVTRESVSAGGTVRVDPSVTNIAALIEGGSLKPIEKPAKGKR